MSGSHLNKNYSKPVPPDRGSFPLDHDNICKKYMLEYMICLTESKQDNSKCKSQSKSYLECRMNNMLMAKEDWDYLGSVATIKVIDIVNYLKLIGNVDIKIVFTKCALHFCEIKKLRDTGLTAFEDKDEWDNWSQRGDPILHIELGKWADLLLVAPLDANTMAKIAQGICDNLVTCIIRAWDLNKPLIFCPAMNTKMWIHPITSTHICQLKSWGFIEIPCISKTLMCKDVGLGAMAEPENIAKIVKQHLKILIR